MAEQTWATQQLLSLAAQTPQFKTRALYLALAELSEEQQRRLTIAQNELDGRTWNPSRW
ncbi:hypothetical protein FD04_GL001742 [Secundilactobacillus odoratitofui DSM 19909 = JCM 15043]|uniref:Uncharacterized protein n=1 Tax=Secundilactobacillus odoratitofui DSM 19909 = JCM 15043 TaxID=1423776 RepID=A0A0R1LLT5_9LACO|nr:hypothetical protein [Secundilactobacillus odoratitofui]KRK96891.1 hypothetical protein FD04_GL001742 [Secundilactobacillus odoratitofui DSM 19909 = JCM 15043]